MSTLARLQRDGFAVLPGFLTAREVAGAVGALREYFPTGAELRATPTRYQALLDNAEHLTHEFPFVAQKLNHISTHPRIIALVEELLGTPRRPARDIRLSQAAVWAKYGGLGTYEQAMHADFRGNTLVVPRDDGDYRQVNLILYYTDVGKDDGPTCVVPRRHMKGAPPEASELWPPFKPRNQYPHYYKHERKIIARRGTLLIFGMGTLHRAAEILDPGAVRLSHHMIYRSANHDFQGYRLWSSFGERPELEHFIESASPRQREVLGFPSPGDPYWNPQTLAGVAARYPHMDLRPYGMITGASPKRKTRGDPAE